MLHRMPRRWSRLSGWQALALLVVSACGRPVVADQEKCVAQLTELAKCLKARSLAGRLRYEEGSRFLLQCDEDLSPTGIGVFVCPADDERDARRLLRMLDLDRRQAVKSWREDGHRYCSYRGPDKALLARLASAQERGGAIFPVACDKCRQSGGVRHHRDGVAAIMSDWSVRLFRVEDLRREEGRPLVGPDCADDRFLGLIE